MSELPTLDKHKLSYNINEAADAIGIHRTTVYELIKAGDLTTFKWGGRTLIRADVLQAALDKASGVNP